MSETWTDVSAGAETWEQQSEIFAICDIAICDLVYCDGNEPWTDSSAGSETWSNA